MVIGIVEDDLFFQEELVSFLFTLPDIEGIPNLFDLMGVKSNAMQ